MIYGISFFALTKSTFDLECGAKLLTAFAKHSASIGRKYGTKRTGLVSEKNLENGQSVIFKRNLIYIILNSGITICLLAFYWFFMRNLTEALNIDFLPYINIGYTFFAPLHFLFFYPMPILLLENAMASSVIFSLDAIKQWKEKTFRTNEGSIYYFWWKWTDSQSYSK